MEACKLSSPLQDNNQKSIKLFALVVYFNQCVNRSIDCLHCSDRSMDQGRDAAKRDRSRLEV
jgi:hypothetical protein